MCRLPLRTKLFSRLDKRIRAVGAPHVPAGTMPKDWPAQPRFLELLKSMRVASRPKLMELEALAVEDARSFYKHVVTILTKQIQARKSRHRVAVPYVINALVTHHANAETAKLYAGRFAPEVRACVAAALECPPEHVSGVRRVLNRWRRRACFSASVLDDAAALVRARRPESGTEREPASLGGSSHETSMLANAEVAEREEAYVLSEADDDDVENDGRDSGGTRDSGVRAVDAKHETRSGADAPTAPAPFKPSLDFAKSRVNRWPTKKPVAAKPPPPSAAAAGSANPPPGRQPAAALGRFGEGEGDRESETPGRATARRVQLAFPAPRAVASDRGRGTPGRAAKRRGARGAARASRRRRRAKKPRGTPRRGDVRPHRSPIGAKRGSRRRPRWARRRERARPGGQVGRSHPARGRWASRPGRAPPLALALARHAPPRLRTRREKRRRLDRAARSVAVEVTGESAIAGSVRGAHAAFSSRGDGRSETRRRRGKDKGERSLLEVKILRPLD